MGCVFWCCVIELGSRFCGVWFFGFFWLSLSFWVLVL